MWTVIVNASTPGSFVRAASGITLTAVEPWVALAWVVAWAVAVVVVARAAGRQERRLVPWVIFALIFGPIAFIVVAQLDRSPRST
jgi:energy-coupling factor transporter transmembrane protein EcfT